MKQFSRTYSVCRPIALNNYLDFCSMPSSLVLAFFMQMYVWNVSTEQYIEDDF